jgi:hypothetical protein
MSTLIALDQQAHQTIRINTKAVEAQASQLRMVPVVLSEFLRLAVQFPIGFTKNKDTGRFVCVALFGFQDEENLFIKNQQWDALYVPLQIRRQPFFLGNSDQSDDQFVVCIDSSHNSIELQNGEGVLGAEAVFDKEGNATPYLENVKAILAELLNGELATQIFIKTLAELKLLQPMQLEITFANGESTRVEGIYTINEDSLQNLNKDEIADLHQRNYLAPIYTMITSIGHIYGLVDRKNKRSLGE